MHLQFLVDIVQVDLDRAFADAEALRELPVAEAAHYHADDLDLALGEDATPGAPGTFSTQQRLERPVRKLLGEPLFACVHFSDAFPEELRRELLEHNPTNTQPQCF